MSTASKFLGALREAFKELDRAKVETADSKRLPLPAPISPLRLIQLIRDNEKASPPEIIPFNGFSPHASEPRMAARKGQTITPEILEKMRDNRTDG